MALFVSVSTAAAADGDEDDDSIVIEFKLATSLASGTMEDGLARALVNSACETMLASEVRDDVELFNVCESAKGNELLLLLLLAELSTKMRVSDSVTRMDLEAAAAAIVSLKMRMENT